MTSPTLWKKAWEDKFVIQDNENITIANVYDESYAELIVHAVNTYIQQGQQLKELGDRLEQLEEENKKLKEGVLKISPTMNESGWKEQLYTLFVGRKSNE